MRLIKVFWPAAVLLWFAACSTGFEVVRVQQISRIEWYNGPLAVLPALTVKGTALSDPNINRLFMEKLQQKYTNARVTNLLWSRESGELLTRKGETDAWYGLQRFFEQTGWINRVLLAKTAGALQVRYLLVPQVLTARYISWEFTGIFAYDEVYLSVTLFGYRDGVCREIFTVRSRGYSMAGRASAYKGAIEMVLRAL